MEGDAELLRALRSDDESQSHPAMATIIDRYGDQLIQQASRAMDGYAAEDIVQALFTDLWTRRTELAITGPLVAYLRSAVAMAAAASRRRKKTVTRHLRLWHPVHPTTDNDATKFLILDDLRRITRTIYETTTGLTRQVFTLSYFECLSEEEIGATLEIGLSTVYKHLRIVRTQIERALIAKGVFQPHEIRRFFTTYDIVDTSREPWEDTTHD